jgi:hypothetical protein
MCRYPIAFYKCYNSESISQVCRFLNIVWPEADPLQKAQHPSFIFYDNACKLLSHIIMQNLFDSWITTTRFIVDAFHYINHRAEDLICRTRCNPAPRDGSQPDLVLIETVNGQQVETRAFNTEAAEQLNAWFGGYEAQLRKMTDYNHDFFVYMILFFYMKDWEYKEEEAEKSEVNRRRKERLTHLRQARLDAPTTGQDYESESESDGSDF